MAHPASGGENASPRRAQLGVSAVLAAVTAGLWEVLTFLRNATRFVLVGLQLPGILQDQDRSAPALPEEERLEDLPWPGPPTPSSA